MDSTVLRVGIAIAGVLLLAAIYFFGRPRKPDRDMLQLLILVGRASQ